MSLTCLMSIVSSRIVLTTALETLSSYDIDPDSISVSGFSAGGFMAAQLGIAYSDVFTVGFGVFAGGPYDCGRDQTFTTCMYNDTPSIAQPLANMRSWSGDQIDCLCNLKRRKIYLQAGTEDDIIGLRISKLLESQLMHFAEPSNVTFVTNSGAAHVFPTDRDGEGNSVCNQSASPYIANCGYDGAGAVLKWLYGNDLNPRNAGPLSGSIYSFAQAELFGAPDFADAGYLYVPETCQPRNDATCKLHVALHGCTMNHELIGDKFIMNTGYNMWADTNDVVVLYPQTTADNATYPTWSGNLSNANACFDWIGQYGNADQKGGAQMQAIVNMVKRISREAQGNIFGRLSRIGL